MEKVFKERNKLVRDKIPNFIISRGGTVKMRFLSPVEFRQCLLSKMHEETEEYAKDKSLNELADMYEVFNAIVENSDYSMEEVISAAEKKRNENGAFSDKVFLEGYWEPVVQNT